MSDMKPVARPLSPHLQIYKPMLSMMMSIMHRITGVALSGGLLLFVWWLLAAALSDDYFNLVQMLFGHWLGKLVLFGFTWALIHHTLGGIRHFVWDVGRGYDLNTVETMVWWSLIGGLVLTVALWALGYWVMA